MSFEFCKTNFIHIQSIKLCIVLNFICLECRILRFSWSLLWFPKFHLFGVSNLAVFLRVFVFIYVPGLSYLCSKSQVSVVYQQFFKNLSAVFMPSNLLTRFRNADVLLSNFSEPILSMGSIDCVTWDDNWTSLTADGSLTSQVEQTLLITKTGAEILTSY